MKPHPLLSLAVLALVALVPVAGPESLRRQVVAQEDVAESIDLQSYRVQLTGLPDFDCISVTGVGIDIVFPTGDKNRKPKGSKPEEFFPPRPGPANGQPVQGRGATTGPASAAFKRKSRIHHIRLERRFTKDRQFHAWIQRAREGEIEARDGALLLQDGTGRTIVRFNFVKARPIRWVVNIPCRDAPKKLVTETVVLCVQSMEMVY